MKVMQVISEIKYILRDAGLPLHAPRYKNFLIGAFGKIRQILDSISSAKGFQLSYQLS